MTTSDGGSSFSSCFKDGYVVSPGPDSHPSFQQYAASARAGDLDGLFSLDAAAGSEARDLDELAYKLLSVAADFGHAEADDLIEDLLECSSLRYDDDRFVQGNAHFELGLAYLMGADGLPADPDKSRAHLKKAHECQWPFHVQQGESLLDEARALLTAPQLAVFEEIYRPT
ncbi:hypothetical protein H1V43_39145 [Streptomyces sp. PSKA54]|uniref:Sel1 repeat family protein n=1 Tax=Streptomyces himalayensis subsp. aureolus TaxID=2758039 RepID=A0A7W2HKI2_9ACTN|nr:hypothetical protein [Streptomyces himalayensis]MBA4867197.1 hypothetical protein [Streptomyces himalayensis subsp. aureolus]